MPCVIKHINKGCLNISHQLWFLTTQRDDSLINIGLDLNGKKLGSNYQRMQDNGAK